MRKHVIPELETLVHLFGSDAKTIKNPKTETSMVSASMIFKKISSRSSTQKEKYIPEKKTQTHQRGSKSDVKPYLFFVEKTTVYLPNQNKHLGGDDSKTSSPSPTHTIHGTNGIFTYIYLICYGFHVGKYTLRPMDPSWIL